MTPRAASRGRRGRPRREAAVVELEHAIGAGLRLGPVGDQHDGRAALRRLYEMAHAKKLIQTMPPVDPI